MKNTALLILLCLACFSCLSQSGGPRLIIRGDDMGYSHSGNVALVQCYREGIQKTIEVIVPSPWFPEAVKMLREIPDVDVGIHLAITSEWDNVKWRPVSDCPSLKDADGYFYPFIWPNSNYPGRAITENAWKIEDIEKEFRAQIELGLKYIPRVSHISAHMGCVEISEEVRSMTRRLAAAYKIDIDLREHGVLPASYDGPHKTPGEKKASFIRMLDKLQPGKTYLFVDHPGIDSPELRAISHIGYEDVATDRQGVTSLWTDKEIIALIRKKGIELIAYRDLPAK